MVNEALKKVNCKEAARLMSERRDRTLSTDETESLKHHLNICINCQRADTQLNFLSRLSKKYAKDVALTTTVVNEASSGNENGSQSSKNS